MYESTNETRQNVHLENLAYRRQQKPTNILKKLKVKYDFFSIGPFFVAPEIF